MKSIYGFTRPYDFARALPFFSAVVLFCSIAITVGVMAMAGFLHWGTYRFDYFLYLAALALVAGALSFLPRLAWGLIALSFIELSLGTGASALSELKLANASFMPLDVSDQAVAADRRFRYHPLLQATPIPNYFRPKPIAIRHDSQGLRGSERSADLLKQQIVIAALGGSTTYDIGVANGQTWPDFLEQKLGPGYAVLNHGVPGYSSVETLIQTSFYLNAYGISPRCAVYYLGWNDTRNAHLPRLDPAYADFHLLGQLDNLQVRRAPGTPAAHISPLARILINYLDISTDPVPRPENFDAREPVSGSDARLERLFRANVQAIAAINRERKITSIFVGQVLNLAQLTQPSRYGWYPLVRDVDVWPLQDHFNHILNDTAAAVGSVGFIPQIDEFQDADFVDNGHFSARGAEKFASMLAPLVRSACGN